MTKTKSFWISYSLLLVLFLMRLVPFAFKDARLWGFNHLIFLSDIYTVAFICLGVIALVLPFFAFTNSLSDSVVNRVSYAFFESRRKYIYRLLSVAVMAGLFVSFSAPTHFLGDGYTLIANLAAESGTFYKWSEKAITFILSAIQALLGPKNEYTAQTAFQIVSVVSGMVSVWFFFAISELVSDLREKRFLTFLALFFSAVMLLFFGYAENYPFLWIWFTGYIFYSLRYLTGGRGLLWASAFLFIGCIIHLQMGIFVPAHLYLLFCRGRGLVLFRRFKLLIWAGVTATALALGILFVHKYTADLYFENIFLPLFRGKTGSEYYSMISLPHLVDIVNQLILLSPLLILLIFLSMSNLKDVLRKKNTIFLFLVSVTALLFLLVIDPKLGMARDWDLFSLFALGPTILLVALASKKHVISLRGLTITILTFFLISACVPFLMVNLSRDTSIVYTKYLINLDRPKSMPALITLRNFYRDQGDSVRADSLDNRFMVYYPDVLKTIQAASALERGDLKSAMSIAQTIIPNKFSAGYCGLMGAIYYRLGNFERALEVSEKAIQLNKYNYDLHRNYGVMLAHVGKYENSLKSLRRALRLNSYDIEALETMASVHYKLGNMDSVLAYSERTIKLDSTSALAYYLLCKMCIRMGQMDRAKRYFLGYDKYGADDPLFDRMRTELLSPIKAYEESTVGQ